MPGISQITSHKIVNSRGDWTIKTQVELDDGTVAEQAVPEGASKGKREAVSLPVDEAIEVVSGVINEALKGKDPMDQREIDQILLDLDGTDNKEKLGGNGILSVSLSVCKVAAKSMKSPLYAYISQLYGGSVALNSFPVPVFNILNGGKHAHNDLSFQEFMIIPAANVPYSKGLEMGVEIYHTLGKKLQKDGFDIDVGDEGGFAPNGFTNKQAFEYIKNASKKKYKVGEEIFFGADVAADSFRSMGKYRIEEESLKLNSKELIEYHRNLLDEFEIVYYEDPFYEEDEEGWAKFCSEFSDRLLVLGDDLTVTNPKVLKNVINKELCNGVIVKPNQVGTLSETLEFIKLAKGYGMKINVSHRSGDTAESTFIADLAVGVGADFIKAGAPARGERVVKYNRLLEIFEELKLTL